MKLRKALSPPALLSYHHRLRQFTIICAAFLAGCSQQPTNSLEQLQQHLAENHPTLSLEQQPLAERRAQTESLLRTPVTPKSAIQLMLLNSPHLQVELARLGVADAARLQASLISNPRLSLTALTSSSSGPWQWDLGLSQSLLELLTRSTRTQQAASESMAIQLSVAQALQLNIFKLQQEYFAAIAARQQVLIERSLLDAARAKQQLAESLLQAGNISELDYLAHLSEALRQERALAQQQQQASLALAELHYLLGLKAEQSIELPEHLPPLPKEIFYSEKLMAQAVQTRIDIQLARLQQQQLLQERTLIRKEYGLADSSVGVAASRESDGTKSQGPQLELAVPLFDRGQARLAIVDAQLASAAAELSDAELHTARDIKQAVAKLQYSQRLQLEPAQRAAARQVELGQREVNFMLTSPFTLIDLKTREIQLQQEQSNASLAYWQARSQLELALGRSLELELQSTLHQAEEPKPATKKIPNTRNEQHKGHHHD